MSHDDPSTPPTIYTQVCKRNLSAPTDGRGIVVTTTVTPCFVNAITA